MQKQTQRTTLTRTRTLRVHGKMSRRSIHRRLAVAVIGAALHVGIAALARSAAEPNPGESP